MLNHIARTPLNSEAAETSCIVFTLNFQGTSLAGKKRRVSRSVVGARNTWPAAVLNGGTSADNYHAFDSDRSSRDGGGADLAPGRNAHPASASLRECRSETV